MKRSVEIVVSRQPVAQPRQRHTVGGRSYLPDDLPIHAFKAAVRAACYRSWGRRQKIASAIKIRIDFVFSPRRRKGWIPGALVIAKPFGDGDNLEKAVWDAMTGIVFNDDSQIADWGGRKRFIRNGETEHVRINLEWNE